MSFYLLDHAQPNTQQWGYPRRGAQLSGTCIVHTAECAADIVGPDGSAEGTAEFIRTRSDYGSYHTLVDSDSIIEMIPYEYEAWQDSETNPWAVGISAAVQADHWDAIPDARRDATYRNLAAAAADFVTYMATKGITVPLRRITGQQARARVPGFCAHGDSGIDRHDPGVQFDWAKFFTYMQQALAGGAAISPQSGTIKPIPKEWDEMASKQDFKDAVYEELKSARSRKAALQTTWNIPGGRPGVSMWKNLAEAGAAMPNLSADIAALKEIVGQVAKAQGTKIDYAKVEAAASAGAAKAVAEAQAIDAEAIADAVVDEQAARLGGK